MAFKLGRSKAKAALALANNGTTLGAMHETDTGNPHVVTKAQVGLGNVDNTSDADKPVSDATLAKIGSAIRYTGIVEHDGAIVTLNADISKIDVTGCAYWLSGVEYAYSADTAISPTIGGGDTSFFVGLDSSGLVYSGTTWSDAQKETILPLCRLQTVVGQSGSGSDLQTPIDQRYIIGEEGWVRRLWHEQCMGALYYKGGEIYESTTPLQISETAGVFYTAQGVMKTISADTNLQAVQLNHVSGSWSLGSRATVVTPKFYDNGTDLVALSNNKWASHTVLRSPKEDDFFVVVISPEVYNSQAAAQQAPVYFGLFQDEATSGLYPICHLLVKGASTNVLVHDHRPFVGESSSGIIGTANLQQIYENSATPEIQTDATRGALTIQEKTADDTANVLEGKNNAGTTTFSVNGRGEVEHAYGWKDLVSFVSTGRIPPSSAPTWANFAPSAGRQEPSFAVNDYIWLSPYHIGHDIDPSAEAYLHVHWSSDGTDTNEVEWELKYTRALGHGQAAFPTETTITITGTPTGTAWTHYVHESATDLGLVEPDELILVTLKRITNGTTENTDGIFGLMVDIHYQSTREVTPNKTPNFYT